MVSQRQRLARKRYKAEHPEQFPEPEPEPTPPKDPDKKKKKKKTKGLLKRKKGESKELGVTNKPFKKSSRKHPLRVPGMKPGESCFICKAKDHIAKFCSEKAEWEKNKVCSYRFCFSEYYIFKRLVMEHILKLELDFVLIQRLKGT